MDTKELYSLTNDGLDIINLVLADRASESIRNPKKLFKLRLDERTPSAQIVPPSGTCNHWGVKDYGIEGGKYFSPIDIYMREMGLDSNDFHVAMQEIIQRLGLVETLKKGVSVPRIAYREAKADETAGQVIVFTCDGIPENAVRVWGKAVKAEHLKELQWEYVDHVDIVMKNGKVMQRYSTDSYPIFAQKNSYIDGDGNNCYFQKVYEPLNYDKTHRFCISGTKPANYIYGLDALKKAFNQNGEQRVKDVVIVSGGSDAVNCRAMGHQPVCRDSECIEWTEEEIKLLHKYADCVYFIADIADTGIRMGRQFANKHYNEKVVWLDEQFLSRFVDNRGRRCKDLKDYLQLRPNKVDFYKLLANAQPVRFWDFKVNDNGNTKISTSLVRLCYFLECNGFAILKEEHAKTPRFVRIDGSVVKEVSKKDIYEFVENWMKERCLSPELMDRIFRSKDLKTYLADHLHQVSLDFSTGTSKSQFFYMKNYCIEVTSTGVLRHEYRSTLEKPHYIWEKDIIQQRYESAEPMFDIQKNEDGDWKITIHSLASNVLRYLINTSRIHWRKEMETRFGDDRVAMKEYADTHKFCINGEGLTEDEVKEQMLALINKIYCIGYLLHSYKVESRARAVILFDYHIGENGECNGRTGKSLFGKILGKYINSLYIEAKNRHITERQFLFAEVTEDTDLIFIDECHRLLDYHFFFGRITGPFSVEKKGIDPYSIEFAKSPKLLLATNYVIREADASTWARLLPCVFSDYYHQQAQNNEYLESRSVRDDFGFELYDTDYQGWETDIQFMTQCVQFYLSIADKESPIMPPMGNILKRQEKARMGMKFEEWADDYFQEGGGHIDTELNYDEVLRQAQTHVDRHLETPALTHKLKAYCKFAGHVFNPMDITGASKDGERWRKRIDGILVPKIYIRSKTQIEAIEAQRMAEAEKEVVQRDIFDGAEDYPF